jgi:hypothetical protein
MIFKAKKRHCQARSSDVWIFISVGVWPILLQQARRKFIWRAGLS